MRVEMMIIILLFGCEIYKKNNKNDSKKIVLRENRSGNFVYGFRDKILS